MTIAPHLVGFAGDVPSDAAARLRGALERFSSDESLFHESPTLAVAFTGGGSCLTAGDAAAFSVLAGVAFAHPDSRPRAAPAHVGSSCELADVLRRPDQVPGELRFEGALVMCDLTSRASYIARDHLGYGSIYWSTGAGWTAFATELKLLLGVLARRPTPDATAIALWLGLDGSRPDISLYEGVHQLPPAHRLVIAHGTVSTERYWSPTYSSPEPWTPHDAVEELRPTVLRALERRLAQDGRTGILMSGGVDSAAVAGLAHSLRRDVVAYSDVFPTFPQVDESQWIDEIVRTLEIDSVRSAVEPQGALLDLIEFIRRWGVPPESANYWGQPLLLETEADGVTTVFTGEGGDEVFAVREEAIADAIRAGRVVEAGRLARSLPPMLFYPPPRRLTSTLWRSGVENAFPLAQRTHAALARRSDGGDWLKPATHKMIAEAADPHGWRRLEGPLWWKNAVFDLTTRVPAVGVPQLFRRLGQAAGCRVCSPLFDVDLVEKALRCPPEISFNGVLSKPLLRGVAQGYVPDNVRLRRDKTLFLAMVVEGIAGTGFDEIARLLRSDRAEIYAYVEPQALSSLLDRRPTDYGAAAGSWAFSVYRLAALECWLRQERDVTFVDRLRESDDMLRRAFTIHRRPAPKHRA